ncbi:MAG: beta-lactamase family protein [Chloroflexi bacterium]|nr:beta-lactamase family protein [Chloroflexota bacterium]
MKKINKKTIIMGMISILIAVAGTFPAAWALPVVAGPAHSPAEPTDPIEVGAFLDGVMASEMTKNQVPGAVVVVVKDGEVLYARGYGYADLETRKPVDPATTLFRPGSVSKLFVWTSVMQLVEQGRLSLDADVNGYLDFKIPATYPEPITLKMLMSHTPGFEENDAELFKNNADGMLPLDAYLKNHIPARVFAPGTVSAYSNYGTALAGYIVERVSGMPFYEYVEKNIFEPLGMTHATLHQPLPENLATDMSGGYNYVNGDYLKTGFEYVVGYPAGGASASGLDMAKFMIAHLQNGRYGETRILEEETAIQMHSQLFTSDPRLTGMAYGFGEKFINGQRVIGHGGDTMVFHSRLFLIPEQSLGVFISTNAAGGADAGEAVERAFVERYFPAEPAVKPIPAADSEARIAAYTGEYYLSRGNFSGFYKAFGLLAPTSVSVDENQRVLAMGAQFVETEPGLLVKVDQPDFKLVMKEENGRVMISSSSPAAWIKARWYERVSLHRFILIGGLILFLVAMFNWIKAFFAGLFKREPRPFLSRLARLAGGLFGLSYLVFLVMLVTLISEVDPAFGIPSMNFGRPSWFGMMMTLPVAMAIFGLLMTPFSVLAWAKRYWTVGARLSYTLLTIWGLAVIWSLYFWNLLL